MKMNIENGWTTFQSAEPYLDRKQGYGVVRGDVISDLLLLAYRNSTPDVLVVAPSDQAVLASLRVTGGVTIQVPADEVATLSDPEMSRLVTGVAAVVGPLHPRAEFVAGTRQAGHSIFAALPDAPAPTLPSATEERAVEVDFVEAAITSQIQAFERVLQVRVRRFVANYLVQCDDDRRVETWAMGVFARALDRNMNAIKARLWRPDGRLVQQALFECCQV